MLYIYHNNTVIVFDSLSATCLYTELVKRYQKSQIENVVLKSCVMCLYYFVHFSDTMQSLRWKTYYPKLLLTMKNGYTRGLTIIKPYPFIPLFNLAQKNDKILIKVLLTEQKTMNQRTPIGKETCMALHS